MSEIYGYARCSTDETRQDIERQTRELYSYGVPDEQHIYREYAHGTDTGREALHRLLDKVVPGDTIVSTEVSRLTRSTQHLCEILGIVQEKKLKIVIGSFVADCTAETFDPMTKGMLMMWGVFSEMERDIISQRVKSGMKNAAAKGAQIGRPHVTVDSLPREFWQALKLYQNGELSIKQMANLLQRSRTTIYSYLTIAGVRPAAQN